jgi:hypothetical protein
VLFVAIGLRFVAIPIGIAVAIVVRRISPAVTSVVVAIFAGYIVGFVILFVILNQALSLEWYDAAAISLIVVAGIVFYISYLVKRSITVPVSKQQKDIEVFTIFDEPVKGSRKKRRRKHY